MTEDSNIDVTMQDGLSISLAGSLVQYSTNPLVRDAMGKNHRDAQVLQAQDSLSQDIANMRQAQEAGQDVETASVVVGRWSSISTPTVTTATTERGRVMKKTKNSKAKREPKRCGF